MPRSVSYYQGRTWRVAELSKQEEFLNGFVDWVSALSHRRERGWCRSTEGLLLEKETAVSEARMGNLHLSIPPQVVVMAK